MTVAELTMYGGSDDYVVFDGVVRGQVDCFDRDVVVRILDPDNDTGAHLRWRYARHQPGGLWSCEVMQIDPNGMDEPSRLPPVRMTHHELAHRSGAYHSVQVTVGVGRGAVVEAAAVEHDGWPAGGDWQVPS